MLMVKILICLRHPRHVEKKSMTNKTEKEGTQSNPHGHPVFRQRVVLLKLNLLT